MMIAPAVLPAAAAGGAVLRVPPGALPQHVQAVVDLVAGCQAPPPGSGSQAGGNGGRAGLDLEDGPPSFLRTLLLDLSGLPVSAEQLRQLLESPSKRWQGSQLRGLLLEGCQLEPGARGARRVRRVCCAVLCMLCSDTSCFRCTDRHLLGKQMMLRTAAAPVGGPGGGTLAPIIRYPPRAALLLCAQPPTFLLRLPCSALPDMPRPYHACQALQCPALPALPHLRCPSMAHPALPQARWMCCAAGEPSSAQRSCSGSCWLATLSWGVHQQHSSRSTSRGSSRLGQVARRQRLRRQRPWREAGFWGRCSCAGCRRGCSRSCRCASSTSGTQVGRCGGQAGREGMTSSYRLVQASHVGAWVGGWLAGCVARGRR